MVDFPGKKPTLLTACKKSLAEPETKRRLYGRRQSRPLNKERKAAFESLLPKLQIDITPDLDPKTLFPKPKTQHWLEIGFGNGEHLAALLRAHPENGYIGIEPYINGMAAFLKDIYSHSRHSGAGRNLDDMEQEDPGLRRGDVLDNIRVLMDDAMLLCENLSDNSLDGIYVLNPDPWPKTRHHKRRIINKQNLDIFARILKPGGALIMSTDVDALAEWMVTEAFTHPAFEWSAESADDWRKAPKDWIKTRYEEKGTEAGRNQTYLIFKKSA